MWLGSVRYPEGRRRYHRRPKQYKDTRPARRRAARRYGWRMVAQLP